ncbi:MAG: PKD domain-containing protein, partial [Bacteroidetes bacterium]|nr:PKD domain-containing protein [Bacteroidota bacterium]
MKMILQSYFIKIIGVSLLLFSALHLNAQAPVANFEVVGARSGCELLIVNFTNRSTGATSYRWDFGDGSAASTVQNPTKAYTRPGVYTVTLTATNASGSNVKTMTNYISVHANPQPSFTASPTSGCVPVTVNFRNTSTASSAIVKSEWNFGDGMVQESTAATIAHTYNTVNTYSISLTMTDANGCTATLSQPSLIRVNALPQPNFTVNPVETCDVPATIMFSSTTPGNIRSFLWDFGDGSTGTAANMPHEYTTKGKKTVKLTVTDANGCTNSITKTEVVNIADFTTNFTAPDKVCLGTESIFTNTSSGTSHTWFINGVQQQASTSSTFRYTFPALGTYKVKLISKNPIGCESAPVEKDVTVIPPTEVQISPNADKHLCLDANQNQNVSFSTTIVSTNGQPITGWEWYVNGTRVGTNENLTYTFPGKGTYTVSLRVRDAVCTGWKDANAPVAVEVHQPTVDFDTVSNNQLGCLVDGKFPVQFNATSDGTIAKWTWTVNGSPMSSMQNPLHTFTNTGVYKVKLAIEDIYGCKNVKEDSIKIGKKIDPELYKNFTSSSPVICYGPQNSIVTFNADPNLPNEWTMLRWYWYNEADERLFKQDRYVTFVDYPRDSRADEVGDFTISFTPYHYACKSDEVKSTWTQTVLPPVAKFGIIAQTSYPAMCDKGRPTTFVDMSQEVRTYTWDFGDKTGANAKNTTLTGHPIGEKGAPANHRLWELKENGVVVISEILRKENINPVFTYKDYGTYLVTLTTETDTVNIPDGCKDTWTSAIVVTKVNPGMNITTAKELCLGTALEAEDISTTEVGGKMSEWLWNFGDGNTGNTEKISYVYPQAGKYNLRLRVTDMYGCQGTTASVPITIWKNPTFDAATIVNPRECAFRAIKFTDNAVSQEATARLKSWEWTFEAGNSITISNNFNGTYKWTDINGNVIVNDTTSKNPSHTFTNTSPATKSVTLKVTDEHECSFQSSIQTILSRVTANIALADTVVPLGADYCYNKNVRLVNSSSTSTYSVASKWDLGDKSPEIGPLTNGNIALQVPPVFTYEDFGKDTTLTIRLVVTERTDVNPTAPGCTDIAYKTVRISRPVSRFSADVNHLACPTPPRPIQFSSAESTTTISSVAWNFGDATPVSTMPNPQHIYEEPGEFAVSLQVTDKFGCVDTRVIDPFITVDGPKGKATAAPNRVCV